MCVSELTDLDPDILIEYILGNHHAVERRTLPATVGLLKQLARSHGARRPMLHEVARRVEGLAARTADQMTFEERALFPYVADAAVAFRSGRRLPRSPFHSIEDPFFEMHDEHEWARSAMKKIRSLTSDYWVPDDACASYRESMQALEALEEELSAHANVEEKILAPRVRALLAPAYA